MRRWLTTTAEGVRKQLNKIDHKNQNTRYGDSCDDVIRMLHSEIDEAKNATTLIQVIERWIDEMDNLEVSDLTPSTDLTPTSSIFKLNQVSSIKIPDNDLPLFRLDDHTFSELKDCFLSQNNGSDLEPEIRLSFLETLLLGDAVEVLLSRAFVDLSLQIIFSSAIQDLLYFEDGFGISDSSSKITSFLKRLFLDQSNSETQEFCVKFLGQLFAISGTFRSVHNPTALQKLVSIVKGFVSILKIDWKTLYYERQRKLLEQQIARVVQQFEGLEVPLVGEVSLYVKSFYKTDKAAGGESAGDNSLEAILDNHSLRVGLTLEERNFRQKIQKIESINIERNNFIKLQVSVLQDEILKLSEEVDKEIQTHATNDPNLGHTLEEDLEARRAEELLSVETKISTEKLKIENSYSLLESKESERRQFLAQLAILEEEIRDIAAEKREHENAVRLLEQAKFEIERNGLTPELEEMKNVKDGFEALRDSINNFKELGEKLESFGQNQKAKLVLEETDPKVQMTLFKILMCEKERLQCVSELLNAILLEWKNLKEEIELNKPLPKSLNSFSMGEMDSRAASFSDSSDDVGARRSPQSKKAMLQFRYTDILAKFEEDIAPMVIKLVESSKEEVSCVNSIEPKAKVSVLSLCREVERLVGHLKGIGLRTDF